MVFIPQYFRVIRAETVRIKAEAFVESARVIGAGHVRIMIRHVLRNATRTLPLILTLNASEAILTLAGLGFLGFGIEPTAAAEWGYDLNTVALRRDERHLVDRRSSRASRSCSPCSALTLVGESLNDLADPRLRTRRARRTSAATCPRPPVVPGGAPPPAPGEGIDGRAEGDR